MSPTELQTGAPELERTELVDEGPVLVVVEAEPSEPTLEAAVEAAMAPVPADLDYAEAFAPAAAPADILSAPEPPADYWAAIADNQLKLYLAGTATAAPASATGRLPRTIEQAAYLEAKARLQ